jgi:glycyl-tRNA synthetase (class II)
MQMLRADIEFEFPFGFKELEGIHSRTDFDLKQHKNSVEKNYNILIQKNRKLCSLCCRNIGWFRSFVFSNLIIL